MNTVTVFRCRHCGQFSNKFRNTQYKYNT